MTWSLMHNVPIILDPVCFVFCTSNLPPSLLWVFSSVQSSSVAQSCLTLCDPMIHHQLPESRSCCWERFGAGGGGDTRGWDGWMASPTRWAWVWVNSGSWWWTERPGVLQFMGSQRVGHDWATELYWTELNQTHVHWVSDAIQPSHPPSSPSPPACNLSQHQGLFKWVSSSHQVAKLLEFQLQHQSFQWTPRDIFALL